VNEAELERMIIRIVGDNSAYVKSLESTIAETRRAADTINAHGDIAGGFFTKIKSYAVGAIASVSAFTASWLSLNTAIKSVHLAAETEKNEVAFGVMLKSAEAGKAMVKSLQDFAAATPLDAGTLQQATKTLLQFGIAGDQVIPVLRMLGDVGGGNAEKLLSMSRVYGKVMQQGRLQGETRMEMITHGFDPLAEIARTSGRKVPELVKDMEHGKISAKMLQDAFKSATAEGGNFFNQMELQSKTLDGLISTMEDDVNSALRSIGKTLIEDLNIKGIVADISSLAQEFQSWFEGMDAGTKQVIFAVALVTAGVIGLTAAAIVLGAVITYAFGGLNIWFALFAMVVPVLIAGISGIIVELGGVAETFKYVKQIALDAWAWLQPIRKALVTFFSSLWQVAKQAFMSIKNFVLSVWDSITKGSNITWKDVQDAIVNAILYAEYVILSFSKSWEAAWAGIKYFTVVAINFIIDNGLNILLLALTGPVGLLVITYDYWKNTFKAIWQYTISVFDNLVDVIGDFFDKLWDGITGEDVDWDDLKRKFSTAMLAASPVLGVALKLGGTDMKALEKQLKTEWERAGLGKTFAEFKAERLAEMNKAALPGKEAVKEAAEIVNEEVDEVAKHASHALGKVDHAAYNSVEAISRVTSYLETNKMTGRKASDVMQGALFPNAIAPAPFQLAKDVIGVANNAKNEVKHALQGAPTAAFNENVKHTVSSATQSSSSAMEAQMTIWRSMDSTLKSIDGKLRTSETKNANLG
jgi:hypothetical protein